VNFTRSPFPHPLHPRESSSEKKHFSKLPLARLSLSCLAIWIYPIVRTLSAMSDLVELLEKLQQLFTEKEEVIEAQMEQLAELEDEIAQLKAKVAELQSRVGS
jgi:hypothetical protein